MADPSAGVIPQPPPLPQLPKPNLERTDSTN